MFLIILWFPHRYLDKNENPICVNMHTHRNTYAYMCTYKYTPEEAGEHMALAYEF